MTTHHVVPQEIIAHLRQRFTTQGIDARPVFVIGPDREDGQIEFFTADGMMWPVVMRVGQDGLLPLPDREADTAHGGAAASLADAVERVTVLMNASAPQPLRDQGLAVEA